MFYIRTRLQIFHYLNAYAMKQSESDFVRSRPEPLLCLLEDGQKLKYSIRAVDFAIHSNTTVNC